MKYPLKILRYELKCRETAITKIDWSEEIEDLKKAIEILECESTLIWIPPEVDREVALKLLRS